MQRYSVTCSKVLSKSCHSHEHRQEFLTLMKSRLLPFNLSYSTCSQKIPKLAQLLGKEEHWKLETLIWYSLDPKSEMGPVIWRLLAFMIFRGVVLLKIWPVLKNIPDHGSSKEPDWQKNSLGGGVVVGALFSCPEHLAQGKDTPSSSQRKDWLCLEHNLSTSHSLHNPTSPLVGQINQC